MLPLGLMVHRLYDIYDDCCIAGCAGPDSNPAAAAHPNSSKQAGGSGGSKPVPDTNSSSNLSSSNTERLPTPAPVAVPYMPLQLSNAHTQAAAAATAPESSSNTAQQQQQQQVEDDEVLDLMSALAQHPAAAAAAAASGPPVSDMAAAAARAAGNVSAAASGSDAFDMEGDESLCVVCWERACTVGLLHGEDVHLCMCGVCFAAYDVSNGCPMCRWPVEDSVDLT
jgi:hypothetical protein